MPRKNPTTLYAICLENEGYEASLEIRKIYRVIPDRQAEEHGMIRVIDEEEEDYLYPAHRFVVVNFDHEVVDALEATHA